MDLKRVDLNLLVALDMLLRERNVTRAGKRMGLSQPAMSAALARLRAMLGDPLLERVGRDFKLTPLAASLAEPVEAILASIERTLDRNAAFDAGTARREFRIAASDYVLFVLFPPLVERLAQLAPGVRLHFQQVDGRIARELGSRRVDLSIQPRDMMSGFSTQDLFCDAWVCAAWRGNRAIGKRITREQFCSLPHAAFSLGDGFAFVDRFIGDASGQVPVHVTCQSFGGLPLLLRGTNLIAVVQRLLGTQLQASADIRLLDLPVELPTLTMAMWWNTIFNEDPAHAWLRGVITDVAAGLNTDRHALLSADKQPA